jgi:hypothetical protein
MLFSAPCSLPKRLGLQSSPSEVFKIVNIFVPQVTRRDTAGRIYVQQAFEARSFGGPVICSTVSSHPEKPADPGRL